MCSHCENAVKKALETLPEVSSATVSHEGGTAVVSLNGKADEKAMKKVVKEAGYKVLSIE